MVKTVVIDFENMEIIICRSLRIKVKYKTLKYGQNREYGNYFILIYQFCHGLKPHKSCFKSIGTQKYSYKTLRKCP